MPDDTGIPLLEHLALSGRPDADFHAVANFALTEFSEVAPALLTLHTGHVDQLNAGPTGPALYVKEVG